MPYNPGVQDISGQLIAQGMNRGQDAYYSNLNNNINQFFKTREEESSFNAKNKAMESMLTANKEQFGFKDDESLKQFLKGSTFESQRDKYARMGTLVETNIMMAKMAQGKAEVDSQNALRAAQTSRFNQEVADAQNRAQEEAAQKQTLRSLNEFRTPNAPIIDRSKIVSDPSLVSYGNANITAPGTGVLSKEILSQFQVPKYNQSETPTYAGGSPNSAVPTRGGGVLSPAAQEDFAAKLKNPYVQETLNAFLATGQTLSPANLEAAMTRRAIAEQTAQSKSIKDPADYKERDEKTGIVYDVNVRNGVERKTPNFDYLKYVAAQDKVAASVKAKDDQELAQSNTFAANSRVALRAIDRAKTLVNASTPTNFLINKTDVEAALNTIKSNVAFQALRELKRGGVSLGQIAKFEIEALEASKGSLQWSALRDKNDLTKILSNLERHFGNIVKANSMLTEGKSEREIGKYLLNKRSDEDVIDNYRKLNPSINRTDNEILTQHKINLERVNNPNGEVIDLDFNPITGEVRPAAKMINLDGATTPGLSPSAQRYLSPTQ
jgi:hypothetical protein